MLRIKVLGSGCSNCQKLEQNAKEAVAMLGEPATVEKVTDFAAIAAYGVMRTPALVVNGKVVVSGRVPNASEIMTMLTTALAGSEG